jgi:phosphate transport system substrate-binding protein
MSGARPALAVVLLAASLHPLTGGAAGAGADLVRISGTGTALGAMRQLAAAFEKAHPGHAVSMLPSVGSSGAIRAVADGALDVGISGRELEPAERIRGLVAMTYARTPFVLAVGPRVGVTSITATELARIYRGEATRWPDGERIRLVMRPRFDVDTVTIRAISPELAAAMDAAMAREGLVMAATNQDCDETLARTPGSIGPSSLTQILTEQNALRALHWEGVAPTLENLASGAYPMGKPLLLVVRAAPDRAVRRFVAFLGTAEARRILEQAGNLPVALPPLP